MLRFLAGLLGALIGGGLGLCVPFWIGQRHARQEGDPSIIAGYSVFLFLTLPLGSALGLALGLALLRARH